MIGLTERQQKMLDFIKQKPTKIRLIAEHFNITITGAQHHIDLLIKKEAVAFNNKKEIVPYSPFFCSLCNVGIADIANAHEVLFAVLSPESNRQLLTLCPSCFHIFDLIIPKEDSK
jgi:hypothetical protein